jgi:hypothetical protein
MATAPDGQLRQVRHIVFRLDQAFSIILLELAARMIAA